MTAAGWYILPPVVGWRLLVTPTPAVTGVVRIPISMIATVVAIAIVMALAVIIPLAIMSVGIDGRVGFGIFEQNFRWLPFPPFILQRLALQL